MTTNNHSKDISMQSENLRHNFNNEYEQLKVLNFRLAKK